MDYYMIHQILPTQNFDKHNPLNAKHRIARGQVTKKCQKIRLSPPNTPSAPRRLHQLSTKQGP